MPFLAHRVFDWRPCAIEPSWGLDTVPSGKIFSICNSLLCLDCWLVFLDIRFSNYEEQRLYSKYRQSEYCELRELYEPGYSERNRKIESGIPYLKVVENFIRSSVRLPAHPRVLDWGGEWY